MDVNINNKYIIEEKIASGGFGIVFKGYKIKNREPIAIKINYDERNLLKHESTILHYLCDKKCCNIPTIYYYGLWNENHIMVMPYYNSTVSDFIKTHSSPNVMKNLFYQSIQVMKSIHAQYVVHRDIKPDNIMIHNNKIMFIDFGLANFYMNEEGFVPDDKHDSITGSPMFVSHFIHQGHSPSIRDDIISLCFVFLKFHLKELPWQLLDDYDNSITYIGHQQLILQKIEMPYKYRVDYITSILKYCYLLNYDDLIDYDVILN